MSYEIYDTILAVVALLPAVILGIYIFKKDRHEKEPLWLLALLFVAGIVIVWPAATIEDILDSLIYGIFSNFEISSDEFTTYISTPAYYAYNLCDNIIGVALVEEGLKWIALFLLTRKSKHFNSLFDGVIYAVFVSLGFATLENILYVFSYGLETGLLRAVTAVPGHVFDAIIMGYSYSLYHIYSKAQTFESEFMKVGTIKSKYSKMASFKKTYLAASIIAPVIIHGLYDFMLSVDSYVWTIIFYIFLAGLYIYCFRKVSKFSKADNDDNVFAMSIIFSHYPEVKLSVEEFVQKQNEENAAGTTAV